MKAVSASVFLLVVALLPVHADIQLSASATVEKPDTSYQATVEMNGTWYALVPFVTTTS